MTTSIREMLRANCQCDDVAKCILGLKTLDMEAYKSLLANGPMTAENLGEFLNRERSTAYRSLQNLISCGLVYRETKTIDIGGYFYEYVAVDPTRVKEMIQETIDKWYEKVTGLVANIDKELLGE
ncbi:TrmB family transcriptional regulator [Methanococcoides sp. SA1]|nr:TrmB family transcriptional regulator [Methanococcoides sp.]NPE31157.1 TrmB family transcriptional regulator [Methanococcoides sp. SA1]